jgi:hypothetical protein
MHPTKKKLNHPTEKRDFQTVLQKKNPAFYIKKELTSYLKEKTGLRNKKKKIKYKIKRT